MTNLESLITDQGTKEVYALLIGEQLTGLNLHVVRPLLAWSHLASN